MKHRVLIVNKFYYRRGGDCVCAMNLEHLLRTHGHDVAVFAMRYPENTSSEWARFWPKEVSFSGGLSAKLAAAKRIFGLGDVRRCFAEILEAFNPDVVHLHNIHSYLSPVLAAMAAEKGIAVVWTMHDYKLLCPSYSCLLHGKPCELCFNDKVNVVKERCMKGSLAASVLGFAEAKFWNKSLLQKYTSRFICPSSFMASKMASGGFAEDKLTTICNFISPEMAQLYSLKTNGLEERKPYYCYVGRLSHEKGLSTLLAAASELSFELRVAGDGPLGDELRSQYGKHPNIKFLGRLNAEQIVELFSQAQLSVMPSECYENNPLGVIESLCAGTPVVGANIGGIPELIDENSGAVFESGSKESLKSAIAQAWHTSYNHKAIAEKSLNRFSSATHYGYLSQLYDEVSAQS